MRIEARGLSVSLSGRPVLGPVSLSLGAGETIGLLGPNGAGKSTLMRALAGLLDSDDSVRIDGVALSAMTQAERARKIAFLPQTRTIGWPLAVARVVELGRLPFRAYGKPLTAHDRDICAEAMRLADVTELASRPATELSGGEQARVLAARAMAQDTPLLIADEPASGLDPAHQIAMMTAFRALAGKGRTVLVSLHDLTLAARWCDRVVVLDLGLIVADGNPADVLTANLLRDVYGISAHVARTEDGLIVAPVALTQQARP